MSGKEMLPWSACWQEVLWSCDSLKIRHKFGDISFLFYHPRTVLIKHRVSTSLRLLQQAMPEGQSVWEVHW